MKGKLNDVHERLLKDRIIFLGVPIDDDAATVVIAKILYLIDADSAAPISLYLNSPGGTIPSCFSIMDVMDESPAPVSTICVGQASGTAAMIVAHGSKGYRFALPEAMFKLVPLEMFGKQLPPSDMEELVVGRLAQDTGKALPAVRRDMRARLTLDARGAVSYGLIDQIVKPANR